VGHDGDEWLQARGAGVAARGEGGGGAVNLGGGRLETKEQRRPNLELAAATMAAAFRSARSTRERGKESGEASECSGSSGVRIWRHREQGGAWRGGRTCGSNGARALLHGCHGDNSTSTWRASLCPTWGPFFGIFRADFELGSSSKVALLRMVYKLG